MLKHFGRYPQRNAELGRDNTAAEQSWLDDADLRPIWAAGGNLGPDALLFDQA